MNRLIHTYIESLNTEEGGHSCNPCTYQITSINHLITHKKYKKYIIANNVTIPIKQRRNLTSPRKQTKQDMVGNLVTTNTDKEIKI